MDKKELIIYLQQHIRRDHKNEADLREWSLDDLLDWHDYDSRFISHTHEETDIIVLNRTNVRLIENLGA